MKCQIWSTYENILLCNKPDEITRFSHAVVRIFCLVVYHLVLGACGIQESDVKIKGTAANRRACFCNIVQALENQSIGIALQDFYRTVKADN